MRGAGLGRCSVLTPSASWPVSPAAGGRTSGATGAGPIPGGFSGRLFDPSIGLYLH
jgi:hypothetical protein